MALRKYQQKRNFEKTKEPKGKEKTPKDSFFVVQEHWASHHHFDLRLSLDKVLKSWAIPREPPVGKGDKRLAVQVEDHPLEYASFEGKIPKGEYGSGEVKIWDKGKLEVYKREDKLIDFNLEGKKLKGNFILLQPAKFDKKDWLFFKK